MDRRNRIIAGVLIGIVAVLAVVTLPVASARNDADPRVSTFRSTANGARALYLALDELDVPVERRLHAVAGGDTLPDALAVVAPTQAMTPDELTALREWVESGGTLFYIVPARTLGIDDTFGLALERREEEDVRLSPARHPWTEGIAAARRPVRRVFDDTSEVIAAGGAEPLLVTEDSAVVAMTFEQGEGRVVAWSDYHAFTNAELRQSGALLLFVRAVEALRPAGQALVFDEFHHGYRAGRGPARATLYFLLHSPLGHAALQLVAACTGLLLIVGARFGAPIPPPPADRRSPIEHVEALGGAYRRANARSRARHLVIAGLARRLGRTTPATPEGERQLLQALVSRGAAGRDPARRLLEEWTRGMSADLRVLAREADRLILEINRSY